MRPFFKLMSITMQQRMYYRFGFLSSLTTPLILLTGQLLLWNSIYGLREGQALGTYNRATMFSYILLAFMINNLLTWSSENTLSREIRSGSVIARRMRPVSFLKQTLAEMCGNLLLQGTVNITLIALAFVVFWRFLTLPSLMNLPLFIISLLLGILVRMTLVSWFSLLCFFTTGHLGITWTRTALTEFFSGALVPVALFPSWLQAFTYWTPFPFMLQAPIAVFLNQPLPMPFWQMAAMQLFWILVFILLHHLLYGRVRRNTTLAGG